MMKSLEHPFLMSMMNHTQQKRQSADAWLLLALLPDIEVSDLEKSEMKLIFKVDYYSSRGTRINHSTSRPGIRGPGEGG
jgi:hypothetical protein